MGQKKAHRQNDNEHMRSKTYEASQPPDAEAPFLLLWQGQVYQIKTYVFSE
jgi:hypothetical protein